MASRKQDEGSSSKQVPDSVVTDSNSPDDHHGIPTAIFFDNIPMIVEEYTAPALIDKLSSLSQKYRFFEERLVKGKDTLEEKIAEVKRAVTAVSALADRGVRASTSPEPVETQFELSDGIYVRASIPQSETVCLWLGANVMVEYNHSEALQLLKNNLSSAESNYRETSSDIAFLRDQLNTTDVNLSRVYNHHVQSVRGAAASTSAKAAAMKDTQVSSK